MTQAHVSLPISAGLPTMKVSKRHYPKSLGVIGFAEPKPFLQGVTCLSEPSDHGNGMYTLKKIISCMQIEVKL